MCYGSTLCLNDYFELNIHINDQFDVLNRQFSDESNAWLSPAAAAGCGVCGRGGEEEGRGRGAGGPG